MDLEKNMQLDIYAVTTYQFERFKGSESGENKKNNENGKKHIDSIISL